MLRPLHDYVVLEKVKEEGRKTNRAGESSSLSVRVKRKTAN